MYLHISFLILCCSALLNAKQCKKCKSSITTASGYAAPKYIYSGDLIFEENFNKLDKQKWKPDETLRGTGVS